MKTYIYIFSSFLLGPSLCFDFPTDSAVCRPSQQCRLPTDCPQAVRDFRENKIQPTICNFRARSLSVCCEKTTNPVKTLPEVPVPLGCGKKNVRTVFQFQLEARQGDLAVSLPDRLVEPAVVGGSEVQENSYPWMAALGSRTLETGGVRWFCGGSLISKNMILTAAHCVQDPGHPLHLVRLGAHHLGESEHEEVDDYAPHQVIVHPEYRDSSSVPAHDIAIVILQTGETGVRIRREVSPVCLPSSTSQLPAGSPVLVAGWGAVSEGGLVADRLQEVTVEVTDHLRCRTAYQKLVGAELGSDILCAGVEDGGKDACQGDSGGPLVAVQGGVHHLVGVVSAGLGCARRNVPGLYADVSRHLDWIEGVLTQHAKAVSK
jgi:secreted trypsin-like serine protease